MEPMRSSSIKRKVKIVVLIIVAAIVVFLVSAYTIIHGYINKMNIVTVTEDSGTNSISGDTENLAENSDKKETKIEELVPESEEADQNIPEASENEISSIEEDIQKNLKEGSTPIKYDEDVLNILLIGSDTRTEGGSGRSDAMILVSINEKKKTITVTSLLRDIYLQITGKKNNRINAAYAFGGADLLMETIEQNFKIQVDLYASVDFYTFIDVVDAVGGVTIEVMDKEIPYMNTYIRDMNKLIGQQGEYDCLTKAGAQLLNGKQALGYVRNRHVGNNDFDRTARQRKVLEQIFRQVKGLNLKEITELLNIVLPRITTNITEGEIFTLILSLPSYINYNLEQWSIPMSDTYSSRRIRGMAVLGIDFEANIDELHSKIY